MFPPRFNRLAETALEIAEALLAPSPASDAASPDNPDAAYAAGAHDEAPGAAVPPHAMHPHRRPLRSMRTAGVGRSSLRRPGALPRPAQPCLTPLQPVRGLPAPTPAPSARTAS